MPAALKRKQQINLLPTDSGDKTVTSRIVAWILSTFRFLVIVVELVVIIGFFSRFFLDSQNADLDDEISQKQALISSYLPFERDFKDVQERLAIAKSYMTQVPFSSILEAVSPHITSDLQLISLQKTASLATISIASNNEQALVNFSKKIKKEAMFRSIEVGSIESVPNSILVKATFKAALANESIPEKPTK